LMRKMKDIRGINSAAVRNAISREFKIQLSSSNRQISAMAICDIILNPDYPDTECAKKTITMMFSNI
ncbi:7532_t:CDS:2, partial [Funneliformis geosporum]